MNQATITINISKVITRMISSNGQTAVTNHNIGDLSNIINNVDVFTVTGLVNSKKLQKVKQTIESNGFSASKINWEENAGFEGDSSDAMNFSIIYIKS